MTTVNTPLRIALTPGEPAGVGPELAGRILTTTPGDIELTIICDRALITPTCPANVHIDHIAVREPVVPGELNIANAPYVLACIDRAVEGCLNGTFDAMVTGPVQKSLINQAGIDFHGHTEYIATATGVTTPVMLLTDSELHVALVTTHLPLSAVPSHVTSERILRCARILNADLTRYFGLREPRIAITGLNPHAGEGGILGREEIEIIEPAVAELAAEGLAVVGPLPADTAFTTESLRDFDAVLAMYHDQGLPVIKARGFGKIANVTLGLPIIRTSVDHGTALDLAGTGQASAASLDTAIAVARSIVLNSPG